MSIYGLSNLTFGINRLGQHQADITQSLERLSTGKRINRASDDPSGLVIATKLNASIYSIERRLTSFQRESSVLGAQEGALSVLSDLLIELDALTVTAANTGPTTQEEQDALADQAQSIIKSIDRINNTSTFQGNTILTGFAAANLATLQIETTDPQTGDPKTIQVTLADLPQLLETDPQAAQQLAELAVNKVSSRRGAIGNRLNAIDSESRVLQSELTNTADALSSIEDADFAKESAKLVRAQILEQATIQTILIQQKQVESLLDLLTSSTQSTKR